MTTLSKDIKNNQLSNREQDQIIKFEEKNSFPIKSMYFNDQIRQAVIKSFCRRDQQVLMPGVLSFLTEHLPMMEYPHQRLVCRHIIATIGREALSSEWQPNNDLMAKLIFCTATFIDEKDLTIKYVLESVFSCVLMYRNCLSKSGHV